MNRENRLEQFIREHRDEFDANEPGAPVWEKLERQLVTGNKEKGQQPTQQKTILFTLLKWGAAAAVVLLAGVGVYSLFNNRTGKPDLVQQPVTRDTPDTGNDALLKEINPTYAKEVYHFTQLIELQQIELKAIEKDNPFLYQKFVAGIDKLDSSYNALKKELPANPNREQLLQAMIENLRLQTEILNQQLNIINQIKASKSDNHESNYKKI